MSESENTEPMEQVKAHSPRKRVRHRKKQLYENILKQIEFYFSDANLSKDRYLGTLVQNDPFVPIAEFLKFNKIRSMTQDSLDIVKSMKHSTFLELSEDKLKVRRKTPMMPYDADLRTVYVESIPVTANREWLQRVFSEYGHIAYISLPKFKNTQKIKGYAFIEFDKPQDAQKCINAFTKMGCKLPTGMPPEELSSIKMFSVDNPDDVAENKEEYEPPKKKPKKNKDKKLKNLELKLENESDSDRRGDTPSDENKSITTPLNTPGEENKSITDIESKDEVTSQDESKLDQDIPRKKKVKKRLGKDKGKLKTKLENGEAPKDAVWGLQVLPKCEWKALRNKYLNLQRKYMKEVKANLQSKRHSYLGLPAPAAPPVEAEPVISAQNVNTKSVAPLEKIPGVFVKEVLPEPCLDIRLTKRTIKTNVHVLHVDVKEGQTDAILRFDSAKAADEYCTEPTRRARVLCGAEEQEQWARAEAARARPTGRGRTRLLARAAPAQPRAPRPASPQPTHTHIRFDE
ncbi:la-related protein 7-like [Epargyreus clarus]|uniref:la-related protein 7-like n=1 Tax=Epargyreus clarus TaxID=520877 RepID=UPI003C2D55B9